MVMLMVGIVALLVIMIKVKERKNLSIILKTGKC